jgi:ferritin-like metal-binding protein YciE
MAITTVSEKYLHEMGDIYDAENQFLEAQQEALAKATDSVLKQGIEHHIAETQEQIQNLEHVYELLGQKAERVTCEAARGIVREYQENMQEAGTDPIRDCLIGGSLSRMEHYEIAGYRSLIVGAQQMGQEDIERLLQQNLQQEEQNAQKIEENAPMLIKKALQAEA